MPCSQDVPVSCWAAPSLLSRFPPLLWKPETITIFLMHQAQAPHSQLCPPSVQPTLPVVNTDSACTQGGYWTGLAHTHADLPCILPSCLSSCPESTGQIPALYSSLTPVMMDIGLLKGEKVSGGWNGKFGVFIEDVEL